MAENEDVIDMAIPGHVSTRKAAQLLGVSYNRLRQYIEEERLHPKQVGHVLMIPQEDIEGFKRYPSGRKHVSPPKWRTYKGDVDVMATDIQARIRPGQEKAFDTKLEKLETGELHLLTGTIQRFIWKDENSPSIVRVWLIWKSNEMPDAAKHEQELEAFYAEFADVLDWGTEQPGYLNGLLYT